jgi:hypothetical protein
MGMVPIFNAGPDNRYIGGQCVPPGEYGYLPEELAPTADTDTQLLVEVGAVLSGAELLGNLVRDILPHLPALTDEQLAEALAIEESDQKRVRVIAAITNLQAERAAKFANSDPAPVTQADTSEPATEPSSEPEASEPA